MTIKRTLFGIPMAVFITTGLGLTMAALIKTDFMPPTDRPEQLSFEINPKVIEVIAGPEREKLDLQQVEIPPAPPSIEKSKSDLPKTIDYTLVTKIPPIAPPTLETEIFTIALTDVDAQPLVRIPPTMPPRADKSGHCEVRFDVSPEGAPFNVQATYCTSSVFKTASIKSVQKWKYNPKILDGRPVARAGVESTIKFHLTDDRGNLIPE